MNPVEFSAIIKKTTNPLPGSTPHIKTYRLRVKKSFEGMTILDFYSQAMPNIPREIWIDKITSHNLKIEDKPVTIDTIVKAGEITQHDTKPLIEPNINTNIALIEWNNNFIVLNKPAPLPVHPGGRFEKNTLTEILQNAFPKKTFKLVHRIDSNTTGILLIALNKNTANQLSDQFKNQKIQKEYLALVEGIICNPTFVIRDAISKELATSGSRKISENGKTAYTEFKVLKTFTSKNQTLLSVIPHSGRTNQIRIHLANMGHPIVGDKGYKDPSFFKNNPLTYDDDCLFLHAWKLAFIHQNNKQSFIATLPSKFANYNFD